jgi:hypothetical protein
MKLILIASLILNVTYSFLNQTTESLFFSQCFTVFLIASLFYLIAKGEANA